MVKFSEKIYVAGHTGLVGSSLMRELTCHGYHNIITQDFAQLDLRNQAAVNAFFEHEKPAYVFLAAAKVGGIGANSSYPADFIYDNLMIATNVIHAAYQHKVKKLINLGSSCIYPKDAPQPLKEKYLLTGPLEETNEPYALAKIAAIKLCRYYFQQYGCNFISAMPTNLYGPGDNYNLETSHVLPALIRKFHEAKVFNQPYVTLWGTGKPYREFLYVDDLTRALVFLMQKYDAQNLGECINIGTGADISIKDLAELIKTIVGFTGEIQFDHDRPDGTIRKLLDVSCMQQRGWQPQVDLVSGIVKTYEAYKGINQRLGVSNDENLRL